MGTLLQPGGGVSVGQLATMWRSVYQKAADAAEARLQGLLERHVGERHGRRAVAVPMGGGSGTLAAGLVCDLEVPWAYVLEGWALYANASGSLAVDVLKSAGYATFPGDLASLVGAGVGPSLAGAAKNRSEALTGWDTALPRGCLLRVVVTSATTVSTATLTLLVRAV